MLLQVLPANTMMGLGLMFILAFFMTYITYRNIRTFIIWLTLFSGFMVYAGLLDLWVMILCIIGMAIVIILKLFNKGGE